MQPRRDAAVPASETRTGVVDLVIDARALSDGGQHRGLGRYLGQLLPRLVADPRLAVCAVSPEPDDVAVPAVPIRSIDPTNRFAAGVHDVLLPRALRRADADVAFSPATDPPRRSPVRWVQTLHDLTPLVVDDPQFARAARRWRRIGPRIRGASRIITGSRSAADQGVRLLGLDARRMEVIYHGVSAEFCRDGPSARRDRPYLLVASAWGPHKGFAEAFEIIARLADAGHPHELVIAGYLDDWMAEQVQRLRTRARRPDLVHALGRVDDLASLMRGADALIVPSRAEGFGLPAIEAMACGVPVVAFDNTSLPEAVGDGGVLVDDGDVVAFSAAVDQLLREPRRRDELVEAGARWSARFDWERSAREHADVFVDVARP